jgi:C-22 sterol desaturase
VFDQLVYTRAVIKEILRLRPPATFVPQMAMADFQLTPDYVVPKGLAAQVCSFISRSQDRLLCPASGLPADKASPSQTSLTPSA